LKVSIRKPLLTDWFPLIVVGMEIKSILVEALNSLNRARGLNPPKSDVELAALRWEIYASLQNVLDAVAMVIADLGLRKPSSYAELGKVLCDMKLIDESTSEDLRLIAVTRNVIAHAYRRLSTMDLDMIVMEILPKTEGVVRKLEGVLESRGIDPVDESNVKHIANLLEGVFRKHNVVLAYLFGSRARGFGRPDSDYDIAVVMDRAEVTVMDEIELALDIADALKVLADKVDVVALNIADTMLKARVLREGVVLYAEDEGVRRIWERKMYLEVLDSMDLHAIYTARTFGRLKISTQPNLK
jgi:uncharacterized protein YutE (UPF0331/DUF86 family)/predicted nucleotidyltransferase